MNYRVRIVLHIITLGQIRISLDGTPAPHALTSKAQALLIYLAITRRPHSREFLANLLWGEMSEAEAQTNLRKALSTLRSFAKPYLLLDKSTVAFDRSQPSWLDVDELERLAHTRSTLPTIELMKIGEAYGGDFLEGISLKHAPDFDAWLIGQRERYRELAARVWQRLAEAQQADGDLDAAFIAVEHWLHLDPWNEQAHRHKMLALARRGQRHAALAQYRACCTILKTELAANPEAETTVLFERIRDAHPFDSHLPPLPTAFVGRDQELAALRQLLAQPACRLITLFGPGGVGKTRLALRLAAEQHLRFLQGVVYVSLIGVNAAEDVPLALGAALGFTFSGQTPLDQLCDFLHNKEVLIVLDNFEHVSMRRICWREFCRPRPT